MEKTDTLNTLAYDSFPMTVIIYEVIKDEQGMPVDFRIVYGNIHFAEDFRRIYGKDDFLGSLAMKDRLIDEYTLKKMGQYALGQPQPFSTYISHANLHVHMTPLTGLPEQYVGYAITDIADFDTQESRVHFLRAVQQMNNNACLFLQNEDGTLSTVYATPAFCEMMECADMEEAIRLMDGQGFFASTEKEDRQEVIRMIKNRKGKDGSQDLTIRKISAKGNTLWCNVHYAFIDEWNEHYVYCTYADVTKLKQYEDQLQSVYDSLGDNFYRAEEELLSYLRVNLTQDLIEEAGGSAGFPYSREGLPYSEAMRIRIRYLPIADEQEEFLNTFSIAALTRAYMDGNAITGKVLYTRLPDDSVFYVKITASLTRHPLSGDIIAFIKEESNNPEKLASTIQGKILAKQFDLVAYIARDRYDVAIGDRSLIRHGNIFPKEKHGSYKEYLETQILPALKKEEGYREKIREEMTLEYVFRMLEEREPYSVDIEVEMEDGVFSKRFDFYSVDPESEYCIVLKTDTTELRLEQKRQEENARELAYSKQELADAEDIIAEAGFGMWHIVLEDGKEPRMRGNEKMKELLGISGRTLTEEEVYNGWHARIPESELPSVEKSVGEMLGGQFSENTYRWEHPKRGTRYVRCGGTAKKEGSLNLLRGYHSDVTELVREDMAKREALSNALVSAEHANRAKTDFLNNMSHDIRTPMNAIVGFTALASSHIDNKELVKDYLGKISISSQHLLSLINDVLDMSRIESGKISLDETEIFLPEMLHEIQTIVQANASTKQLELRFETQDVIHTHLIADKLRLNQIFLNILSNAVKFTPHGGTISFRVIEKPALSEDIATFEFHIRDNGIGMSEEFQKTIFEAFTREKTSTVSGIQGTGLGMAITKSIVDMMGGSVTVNSKEGEGTEFTVTLPCRVNDVRMPSDGTSAQQITQIQPTAAPREEEQNLQEEKPDFTGKRILLAEDNEMNQMIAVAILTEAGFAVDIAGNGKEAIRMMEEMPAGTYDIVLMDIQMPEMDGYEAASVIRKSADETKAQIPIIAVTANAFEEDKRSALEAGMNGHLAKPYDIPKMMETLGKFLH